MAQGDSTLSRPTKDSQNSSCAALGVVSPVVGFRGLPGSKHQSSGRAFTRGAHPKRTPHRTAPGGPRLRVFPLCVVPQSGSIRLRLPSRRPTRHQQVPPPGAPVCTPPSGRARIQGQRRAQRTARSGAAAAIRRRPTRVQARTGAHESAGGHPRGRGRTQAAPAASAAHLQCSNTGSPPAQRVSAPPAGRAATSPQLRAAPVTRGSLRGARPHLRGSPVHSSRPTPLWAPDRPLQRVHAPI
ncbi:hypothetical protein NDU88_000328 [Pleurodeles waltl]|uniref:Uncharacterized protein n=1 Tax=Pleurodeles waltl TaxID=8319 RepID=A0AAV7N9Z5_PLEWA|nr:hypothetical protein NDU88_000328 [Pleurodeles waltl]